MTQWQDEVLEPMPPPPAPQAHPQDRDRLTPFRNGVTRKAQELEETLTPQTPPLPHKHPLVALSDESARNVKLQQDAGGMAIHSSQRMLRRFPIVSGKRLDPTFLSRERIAAFTDLKPPESESPFAVETEHSSRAIALQLQRQVQEAEKELPPPALNEQEKTIAATEASARRNELLRGDENSAGVSNDVRDSALARASERKVPKQLSAKWLQSRQDPANRPKGPLERPEERDLRETLFRTTVRELIQSGVLFDEEDAARSTSFEPMSRPQMPMISNGIVGLEGCCFEKY